MYRGERINSITHLVGSVLALGAVVFMITAAALWSDAWKIVSVSLYGATLILLYLFSTLYHSLRGRAKKVFRILDHQAIYLLIAGTYTPYALVTLRDSIGWWLFGANWTLAVIGMVLDAVFTDGKRIIPMIIYVVMGWMIVVAMDPLLDALPDTGFDWLLAGGILYTAGIIFYVLDHWHKWAWHLAPVRARRQRLSLCLDTALCLIHEQGPAIDRLTHDACPGQTIATGPVTASRNRRPR